MEEAALAACGAPVVVAVARAAAAAAVPDWKQKYHDTEEICEILEILI